MEGSVPVSGSSSLVRPNRKPLMAEEEIKELLWQDGHPVVQSYPSPKDRPKPPHVGDGDNPTLYPPAVGADGLFMQEDDMVAWPHYDEPFYGIDLWRFEDGGPSESSSGTGESMLVDAFSAAVVGSPSLVGYGGEGRSTGAVTSEMEAPEHVPDPPAQRPRSAEGRKRAGGAGLEEAECDSEDVKFRAANTKKPRCMPPGSPRRSRSAEVHNRSERKRRDRINEKIKALQQLIPRSGKAADKASTLDCTIEYLKTLQRQLQMMSSMGCGMMVLMTYPCMNVGMGMGELMPLFGSSMAAATSTARPPFPTSSPFAAAILPIPSHHATHLHCWGSAQSDHPSSQTLYQLGMQNPLQQQPPLHLNHSQ